MIVQTYTRRANGRSVHSRRGTVGVSCTLSHGVGLTRA